MGTYRYSIVRFVPDPARGERLNVGVVVAGEDPPYLSSMFLPPHRASRLRLVSRGTSDFSFLRDLADEIGSEQQSRLFEGVWNLHALERAAAEWSNTIQFSPLRAALHEEPNALLHRLFTRYVGDYTPTMPRARGRRWLRKRIRETLAEQLTELRPELEIESVVSRQVLVHGAFDEHVVDFVLHNGAPRSYVQTLSFEPDERTVRTDVDVLKWTIDDLRQVTEASVPVTVVTLGSGELLDRAQAVYERLDAAVVREQEIEPWVEGMARELVGVLH